MKKIYFISAELSKFLYADSAAHNLNIVNMGVALFHRNSSKFSSNTECIFRISQDGLLNLIPFMTKRIVWAPTTEDFKQFLMAKSVDVDSIKSEELRESIANFSVGCFVLALRIPREGAEGLVEGLVMHKFPKCVGMMVSRENVFGLHLRYLSREERESVAAEFDQMK